MRLDPAIVQLLGRVRRRLRWMRALEGGAWALTVAFAVGAGLTFAMRRGALSTHGYFRALAVESGIVVVAALLSAARRFSLLTIALQVDGRAGLHERLSSAVAFTEVAAPSRFMAAALADAARVAGTVRLAEVAPWRRPRALRFVLGALVTMALAGAIPRPHAAPAPPPHTDGVARLVVERDQLEPDVQSVSTLVKESRAADDETGRAAAALAELLSHLDGDTGALSRKEVFERLAQIQSLLPSDPAQKAEQLKQALDQTAHELAKNRLTQSVADELAKEDLAAAKEELEKLAQAAEARAKVEPKLTDAEREQLAASLERAAKVSQQSEAQQKEQQRLKEERRRLQRQVDEHPQNQEARRRLERNQRELEKLEREQQQRAEQRRQLERLQRELDKAAESLRQKMSPEAAEALRKAGQQMGNMEDELRKLGRAQRLQLEIGEIKEVVRRAGQSQGNGQNGQNGKNAQNGTKGDQGEGQRGQGASQGKGKSQNNGKAPSQLMREFQAGAGGNKREQALLLGGKGQEQNQTLLLPLPGDPQQKPPGPGQGPDPQNPHGPNGDGIGDEHDPHLQGARTDLHANRHATRVHGAEGEGPSRSETIAGSAQHGFATQSYQRVFGDYSTVLEEVMQKENVPPGYRYYVKRYFQLIAPR